MGEDQVAKQLISELPEINSFDEEEDLNEQDDFYEIELKIKKEEDPP